VVKRVKEYVKKYGVAAQQVSPGEGATGETTSKVAKKKRAKQEGEAVAAVVGN
jgi:hypothetical protein